MQKRIGMNTVSPISSLVHYNKKHVKTSVNKDDHNSELLPEISGENPLSGSTSLRVPFIQKPLTSQIFANTSTVSPCDLPSPSPISLRQTDQIEIDQPAVLKNLSIFNWHSHSSYTEVNGHVEDFATTTTSTSQNHLVPPYRALIPDWWWNLLNFQSGIAICQAMTVLFLTCKREATHGSQCQQSLTYLPPLFQVNSSTIIIKWKPC